MAGCASASAIIFPSGVVDDDGSTAPSTHVVNPDHLLLFSDGLIEGRRGSAEGAALGDRGAGGRSKENSEADARLPRLSRYRASAHRRQRPPRTTSIADRPGRLAHAGAEPAAGRGRRALQHQRPAAGAAPGRHRSQSAPERGAADLSAIEAVRGVRPFTGRLFLVLSGSSTTRWITACCVCRRPSRWGPRAWTCSSKSPFEAAFAAGGGRRVGLNSPAPEPRLGRQCCIGCADTGPGFDHELQVQEAMREPPPKKCSGPRPRHSAAAGFASAL